MNKKMTKIRSFIYPALVGLIPLLAGLLFVGTSELHAATVTTRVTGAANWNTAGSATVTGTGTLFTTELQVGDVLMLQATPGTVRGTVASIASNF